MSNTGARIVILLLILATSTAAQEAGNRVYGNQGQNLQQGGEVNRRYPANYGDLPDEQITAEQPNLLVTTYQFIDAKLLTSVVTKEYVAVFGLMQEAPKLEDANKRLQTQITVFQQGLAGLGVPPENIYLDFITQNRTYDYQVKNNTAREKVSGFQVKENIAVRFKDHKLLDKIVPLASSNGIFDLIKVDYVTEDLTTLRAKMMDEALKIVEKKREAFTKLGLKLMPVTVVAENFDTFQPFEAYNSYRAYETGNVDDNYRVVEQRKSSTLYFEPLRDSRFDAVLAPIGLEPQVQCTYYLRVKYFVSNYATVTVKPDEKKP